MAKKGRNKLPKGCKKIGVSIYIQEKKVKDLGGRRAVVKKIFESIPELL
jgi:hypothetical protein